MRKAAILPMLLGACFLLSGCQLSKDSPDASPTLSTSTPTPADVSGHESGPDSPIAYGLKVPSGAIQLGPLQHIRSQRLIAAFQPELDAALAQKAVEEAANAAKAAREGTPLPSTAQTPDPVPGEDTFRPIDKPPRADITTSYMRVDGKPADVVRRMLAQISAALPSSDVVTDDLSKYCASTNRRITSCRLAVRALTSDDRDIRITMTVDPGNVVTRTSPPSAHKGPVMTLTVQYVGEPRAGQLGHEPNQLRGVPPIQSGGDTSGLIWPGMDEDAPSTITLVHGWIAPANATILLSGFTPMFVMLETPQTVDADLMAKQFAASNGVKGAYTKDVVEDLNEVSTTYTAIAADGSIAQGTFVLSARGNYTMLSYGPPPN